MTDSKSILPAEFEPEWDDEAAKLFAALSFGQQTFVMELLKTGNGRKAYQAAYPNVSNTDTACALASRMIRTEKVKAFLDLFRDASFESLLIIRKSLQTIAAGNVIESEYNGTTIPLIPKASDITAAAAQLAKLEGLNAPEKIQDDRFTALVNLMNTRGKHGAKEA